MMTRDSLDKGRQCADARGDVENRNTSAMTSWYAASMPGFKASESLG